MKVLSRIVAQFFAFMLAALYLLSPAALIFAQVNTQVPPPTCYINANPTSIAVGGSVTITWSSTNATAGAITNIGNVGPSGSINLLPSSAAYTTYIGSFTGPGGTANCEATVAVNSATGASNTAPTPVTTASTPVAATLPTTNGGSGLIPCGYGVFEGQTADPASSTGCQACNLAQLIQNIITFAIGLSIPIAAALFAYAGFLFFTSADSPNQRTEAKKIFKNALIGFVIAITAWLVINTVLNVIFSQGEFAGSSWFTIQCDTNATDRPVSNTISQVLSSLSSLGISTSGMPTVASSGGTTDNSGSGTTCAAGFQYVQSDDGGTCYNADTDTVQYPINPGGASSTAYNSTLETLTNLCDTNQDTASCNAANQYADTGQVNTAIQDVLDDACGDNSSAACTAAIPVTGSGVLGASENSIAAASLSYKGTNTSAGPGGGNVACAWAVNNVLTSDGIAPIDGNSVAGMQQQLQSGRGTAVDTSDAQAGDIIIWKSDTVSHVGICENAGCTTALSNSSSNASFTNISGSTLMGVAGQVYRVNQ